MHPIEKSLLTATLKDRVVNFPPRYFFMRYLYQKQYLSLEMDSTTVNIRLVLPLHLALYLLMYSVCLAYKFTNRFL